MTSSSPTPSSDKPRIKIAYIGGGSRNWARHLMQDLALSGLFEGEIALYDLDHAAAQRNAEVARHLFSRPEARGHFRAKAVKKLTDCLRGADFVVLSIEPGPTEAREADLEIPRRYGVIQPVGDSTGPGGILRGLRAVPVYAEFGRQIMEHCPQAWVINYTNPMTLCTRALHAAAPGIRAFGCCHEVFGTQYKLSQLAKGWFDDRAIARHDIAVDVTGVNHFTWVTAAQWKGEDLMGRLEEHVADPERFTDKTREAKAQKRQEKYFGSEGLVALDLARRFGALAAAGDRHLVEFVPWYARDEKTLHRWGVVCTPYAYRLAKRDAKDSPPESFATRELKASGEEGVRQMAALWGLADLITNVNLPNTGQAPDLPMGAVVETNAAFRHGTLPPLVARPMPSGAALLVQHVVAVQELTLEAAFTRDLALAGQAMQTDPLVTLSPDATDRMFAEMTQAIAPLLRALDYPF